MNWNGKIVAFEEGQFAREMLNFDNICECSLCLYPGNGHPTFPCVCFNLTSCKSNIFYSNIRRRYRTATIPVWAFLRTSPIIPNPKYLAFSSLAFYLYFFCFEIILDIEKLQKQYREFPYTLCPVSCIVMSYTTIQQSSKIKIKI